MVGELGEANEDLLLLLGGPAQFILAKFSNISSLSYLPDYRAP